MIIQEIQTQKNKPVCVTSIIQVITKYIEDEKARDRMLGPFPPSMRPAVHVNRFGVIPKGNTGKFCLITLSYSLVDDVAEIVVRAHY